MVTRLTLGLTLGLTAHDALAQDRVAGTVVAVQGDTLVVELGDEPAVAEGTVLTAWRQLPSRRGDAAYRKTGAWFEIARLTVLSVGDGIAVVQRSGEPSIPVPLGLDETGADPSLVHVGDRVRTTGAVAARPVSVRVTFAGDDLYRPQDVGLSAPGADHLKNWLRGLRSMQGPIVVEVHARLEELGGEAPDLSRSMSADEDAPFGPTPGSPVVPVDGLRAEEPLPQPPPEGDEVLVVAGAGPRGTVDAWHYLDPVTLALRRGEAVAGPLASKLGLREAQIQVRVVPRGAPASYPDAPGHDRAGDQVRILASGMDWSEPPPLQPPKPKKDEEKDEEDKPKRRLLERPPLLTSTLPGGES